SRRRLQSAEQGCGLRLETCCERTASFAATRGSAAESAAAADPVSRRTAHCPASPPTKFARKFETVYARYLLGSLRGRPSGRWPGGVRKLSGDKLWRDKLQGRREWHEALNARRSPNSKRCSTPSSRQWKQGRSAFQSPPTATRPDSRWT